MKDFLTAFKEVLASPRSLLVSIAAVMLYTFAINMFITPLNLFPTGMMGLVYEVSTALEKFVGIHLQPDKLYFYVNIPVLILGYFQIGKKFTIRTLIVVAATSISMHYIPVIELVDDTLLSVIASAVIQGVAIALMLNYGASSGGTDIIALYMSIKKGKSFGVFNAIFNAIVIGFAVVLTGDLKTAIYLLMLVYIVSVVIDRIHTTNQKRTMIIVTQKSKQVKQTLFDSGTMRGITVIDSKGGYSGANNTTLILTCEKSEYPSLVRLIKDVDEHSFISTFATEEVIGAFESTYVKSL